MKLGRPSAGRKPEKTELMKLYIKEAKSIRDIATIIGCSKDMVPRSLKEYEIDIRPGYNRSRLRVYDFPYLRREITKKGYKEFSRELGVDVSALRKHIKKREDFQDIRESVSSKLHYVN